MTNIIKLKHKTTKKDLDTVGSWWREQGNIINMGTKNIAASIRVAVNSEGMWVVCCDYDEAVLHIKHIGRHLDGLCEGHCIVKWPWRPVLVVCQVDLTSWNERENKQLLANIEPLSHCLDSFLYQTYHYSKLGTILCLVPHQCLVPPHAWYHIILSSTSDLITATI